MLVVGFENKNGRILMKKLILVVIVVFVMVGVVVVDLIFGIW